MLLRTPFPPQLLFLYTIMPAAYPHPLRAAPASGSALLSSSSFIFTDVYSGKTSGASPGFAVSLWAETTTDCRVCAEAAAGAAALPEDLGQRTVGMLLNEVFESGCVDSMHQPLVLTLMALSPEDVSRIRLGRLSHQAVLTLRLIRDFFGVV